jgi:methionyl-tRNA formyltransferase
MQMDTGLDTGDMLLREAVKITSEMTANELHDDLSERGARALLKVVDAIGQGNPPQAVSQDEAGATYAAKLKKEEGEIDWENPADAIVRQIKAFNPWPVAYTRQAGKLLRIWDAKSGAYGEGKLPGTLLELDSGLPVIACGQGCVVLLEVQAEGKKRMSARDYMNARKDIIQPGIKFG